MYDIGLQLLGVRDDSHVQHYSNYWRHNLQSRKARLWLVYFIMRTMSRESRIGCTDGHQVNIDGLSRSVCCIHNLSKWPLSPKG